ncbi:MAG: thiamine pyrophosphate-dependent dehydrogenase E1 component subunit alpha [Variovorax sp.]|nr:MAG: thiamine pyrophosphate-dependent dehydrogenase E1 component subunit alpha [Variovorax sp.]
MSSGWTTPGRDTLERYLHSMVRIRRFEEKVTELRKAQTIVGSVHLCSGQEAIYVGTRAALTEKDRVFGTYRGHGWALACGAPPAAMFAELLGRETGVCKGRGGSAQLSASEWGFFGENSIVGAGAAVALGAALSAKMEGAGRVAVTAFGEGAMNQGAVHEAMNFAAYQSLPLIFVCENNTYSELTPTEKVVRNGEMFQRAQAYGMPGVRVDGNDPHAVCRTVAGLVEAARRGDGPALVEAMTQRLVGHYYGDMQSYRPKGEVPQALTVEPIVRARAALKAAGASAAEVDELERTVHEEVEAAAQEALAAPLADVSAVREHLYA